ncbi:hypothetical protein L1887_34779 [Cichorium endivia]|nr:hypothetical protein L1887_34779 [Cichorium endivia]
MNIVGILSGIFLLLALYCGVDPFRHSAIADFPDFESVKVEMRSGLKCRRIKTLKICYRSRQIKFLNQIQGPESVAFDLQGRGPYTGIADGWVVMLMAGLCSGTGNHGLILLIRLLIEQKRSDMSVSKFVAKSFDFSLVKHDNSSTNNLKGKTLLYLKDWHFVKEYPEYTAYASPPFFLDDWLNLIKEPETFMKKSITLLWQRILQDLVGLERYRLKGCREIHGSENASHHDRSLMRHFSNDNLEGSIRRNPTKLVLIFLEAGTESETFHMLFYVCGFKNIYPLRLKSLKLKIKSIENKKQNSNIATLNFSTRHHLSSLIPATLDTGESASATINAGESASTTADAGDFLSPQQTLLIHRRLQFHFVFLISGDFLPEESF